MLDKLGGVWAPRPSTGPHKLRECLPLIILLRNRLKYALNTKEVKYILMQRLVKVDGKARTDKTYPAGFMGARLVSHYSHAAHASAAPRARHIDAARAAAADMRTRRRSSTTTAAPVVVKAADPRRRRGSS